MLIQNLKVQDEHIMSAVPPELLTNSHSTVQKTLLFFAQPTALLLITQYYLYDVQIAAAKVLFTQIHFMGFTLSPTH